MSRADVFPGVPSKVNGLETFPQGVWCEPAALTPAPAPVQRSQCGLRPAAALGTRLGTLLGTRLGTRAHAKTGGESYDPIRLTLLSGLSRSLENDDTHPRRLVRRFSFQMPAQTPLPTLLTTRDLASTPGHCSLGAALFTKHVNWGSLGSSME